MPTRRGSTSRPPPAPRGGSAGKTSHSACGATAFRSNRSPPVLPRRRATSQSAGPPDVARRVLVGLSPDRFGQRRPAAADTRTGPSRPVGEGQAADRRRAVVLDPRFALPPAAPRRYDEPRRVAEVPDQLFVAARVAERSLLLFGSRGLEERRLDVAQQLVDCV